MGVDKAVPYAICIMGIGVGIGGEDEEGERMVALVLCAGLVLWLSAAVQRLR